MRPTDIPWTGTMDDQLRQLVSQGATAAQAAPHLGRTRNAVISRARKIGAQFSNSPEPWTAGQDTRLMQLLQLGWTAAEVGEELGKTKIAVQRHVKVLRKRLEMKATNQHSFSKPLPTPELRTLQKFTDNDRKELIASVGVGFDLPMEELHDNCCRYPVNNDPPFRFCGAAQHRGVYCEAHAKIVFQVEKAA